MFLFMLFFHLVILGLASNTAAYHRSGATGGSCISVICEGVNPLCMDVFRVQCILTDFFSGKNKMPVLTRWGGGGGANIIHNVSLHWLPVNCSEAPLSFWQDIRQQLHFFKTFMQTCRKANE